MPGMRNCESKHTHNKFEHWRVMSEWSYWRNATRLFPLHLGLCHKFIAKMESDEPVMICSQEDLYHNSKGTKCLHLRIQKVYFYTLKMAGNSPKMSVKIYQFTLYQIPDYGNLHNHWCKELNSHMNRHNFQNMKVGCNNYHSKISQTQWS
jgi:hypothetical protein